ncbi:ankyrin repeat-containing protein ITN1-like [Magnolia sinica]|uniref:ankyrin repeat-containing protein ITN1-like n=1 Tax=Magnolia sinica TaxID=86752 RepID=UPI002657EB44|nr:ankyrin repeat-containing protein ITN1-like [Magnolia sinica]
MGSDGGEPDTQIQSATQGNIGSQGGPRDTEIRIEFPPGNEELHDIKEEMLDFATSNEWVELLELCKENPDVREAQITPSGDTALHLAIFANRIDFVEGFLKLDTEIKLGNMVDGWNNTPLHVAAAQGRVKMCRLMASIDPMLIKAPNKGGETPLFSAVLHGKTSAFVELHRKLSESGGHDSRDIRYCMNRDKTTILHSAIIGEFYDLAHMIFQGYPYLVRCYNDEGESCLHLLANQPSSFISGYNLGPIEYLIYHCLGAIEYLVHHGGSCIPDLHNFNIIDEEKSEGKGGMQSERNDSLIWRLLEILLVISTLRWWCQKVCKTMEMKRKHERAHVVMEELVKECKRKYKHILTRSFSENDKSSESTKPKEEHVTTSDKSPPAENEKQIGNTGVLALMEKILNTAPETTKVLEGSRKNVVSVKMHSTQPNDYKLTMAMEEESKEGEDKHETPILVAARMGVKEMVQTILKLYPMAIQLINPKGKNVVLLAVENRQPNVYKFLLDKYYNERVFNMIDYDGNTALHLAARYGKNRPWLIHGAALQLQWEIKWYKSVGDKVNHHFYTRKNKEDQIPKEVFTETHEDLVKEGSTWLINTSQSCSIIAALIATVAFATSATVPGGLRQDKGEPVLEGQPIFDVFAITSLVALCFSITSLTIFLTILTSRYRESDFESVLPWRLIFGLTTLFLSLATMLVSFCAGHFFVLKKELKLAALPVYVVACFPITIFAFIQFPLYFDLCKSTFTHTPKRTYELTSL